MFRHMAIIRLDPLDWEKNTFCNALLGKSIYNDCGGETRSRFTVECGGFGMCWVCRIFVVGPLAWRPQALLWGWCSWAGPCVFWATPGFVGFFVVILGFRSGSVDFLDAVLCSILYEAHVKKLQCLCGSSNTYCRTRQYVMIYLSITVVAILLNLAQMD
jgi:hypothetical protein